MQQNKTGYKPLTRATNKTKGMGGKTPPPPPKKKKNKTKQNKNPSAEIRWKISRIDFLGLIDYLPKGRTINAEYYSSLLVQLKDILKGKTPRERHQGVLFLHDKAAAHWALATQKKLAYLGFQCLDQPSCSPDLAPSDYHRFPGLKKQLKGRYFSSDAEVIATVETWLDGQPSEYFF